MPRATISASSTTTNSRPSHWLFTLYRAIQSYGVDGGLGPVYPFYRQKPPLWVLKGGFGERPVIRTGTLLSWDDTRTGNVLLKRGVFDRDHLRFDPRWRTSGSDRAFFKEAIAAGYRFIAVKEAPVYETVPPQRWKKTYYLRRALVQGYNTHKNVGGEIRGVQRITVPMRLAAAAGIYALALPFSLVDRDSRVCQGPRARRPSLEPADGHVRDRIAEKAEFLMGVASTTPAAGGETARRRLMTANQELGRSGSRRRLPKSAPRLPAVQAIPGPARLLSAGPSVQGMSAKGDRSRRRPSDPVLLLQNVPGSLRALPAVGGRQGRLEILLRLQLSAPING